MGKKNIFEKKEDRTQERLRNKSKNHFRKMTKVEETHE